MIGHFAVPQRVTKTESVLLRMEQLSNGAASADFGEIICVLDTLQRMQWVLKVDNSVERLNPLWKMRMMKVLRE